MHVSYRILLSCAVLSAVFTQTSLWSAAACADEYDDFVAASVKPEDDEDDDFVAAPERPTSVEDDDFVAAPERPADDEDDYLVPAPARPLKIGALHLIVARSTSEDDPLVKEAGDSWIRHIRGIMGFESSFSHNGSPYPWAFDGAARFGVGLRSYDYASARFLEGQDVEPRNLVQTCREVSQEAGSDDAIVVFVWSRAASVPGSSGEDRHVLFPTATSNDFYDRGVGIPRGTILNALKEKEHRLIVLITFSYEVGGGKHLGSKGATPSVITDNKQPEPRRDSFLKALMQGAAGEVNINVDSVLFPGASYYRDPFDLVVLNGLYLNSEINVDSFYDQLKFAGSLCSLEHERLGFSTPYRMESYEGNSRVSVLELALPDSFNERLMEMEARCQERRTKLMQSAEIEKRERYFDERQLNYFRPQ